MFSLSRSLGTRHTQLSTILNKIDNEHNNNAINASNAGQYLTELESAKNRALPILDSAIFLNELPKEAMKRLLQDWPLNN
jgi:hypothetical protein